jgi:hypothetical protein
MILRDAKRAEILAFVEAHLLEATGAPHRSAEVGPSHLVWQPSDACEETPAVKDSAIAVEHGDRASTIERLIVVVAEVRVRSERRVGMPGPMSRMECLGTHEHAAAGERTEIDPVYLNRHPEDRRGDRLDAEFDG